MKKRLLNFSRNLIITIGLVVIVMILFFTTSSYAASGDTLGSLMRATVSDWYNFILNLSLTVYAIGYLIIVIKLLADRTPERLKIVKESILRFFVMFAVIYFLHIIMLLIINLNAQGIETAKRVGTMFSGIDMKTDEYDLYETALSKAYEIAAVPGFIGLLMYLLLVYYTYKFVIVYAKRYINVIVLILLAPIIFVMSTIKKILTGVSDGKIGKWFKEFIFNIIIQTLHAIFYAILIGLTLKMSDNDENLIGALLTLILFGFIFKIDAIVRKIFNFVGGSTNISSSKAANRAINAAGGAINTGLGAIAGAADNIGNNVAGNGLRGGLKQSFEDGKGFFKDKAGELGNKITNLPGTIKDKTVTGLVNIKTKSIAAVENAVASAKAEANDLDNILNGNRVKANLTADEIVEQQHIIDEGKGLEGLRQKVQGAGLAIAAGGAAIAGVGKYTGKQIKRAAKFASGRVQKGLDAATEELNHDIENLENNIEMIKRIPKVIKSLKKEQKYIKNPEGLNVDVSNAMMLVVDSELSPEDLIRELKAQFGDDIDVAAFVLENVGAQAFLSPVVGSPRMGMSVLAEENYESKAEHRIEELLTGKKRKKRKIKKASRRISKRAVKKATQTIEQDAFTNKVYKFSRFTPDTARKITKRLLKKNREQNRYLFVIGKTYQDIQINNIKARGRVKREKYEYSDTVRMTRNSSIRSIRKIKLSQRAALAQYREVERQTRNIEQANNVAGAVMTAKNTIKLGFKYIENMTPGQIGLRSMIREGTAEQLSSGLFAIKQPVPVEEKVRATGVVNEQEKIVVQFVIDKAGELTRQVVTMDGKIVEPAPELKAIKAPSTEVAEELKGLSEAVDKASRTETITVEQPTTFEAQQTVEQPFVGQSHTIEVAPEVEEVVQHIVTLEGKIVEQVVRSDNTIVSEKYQVVGTTTQNVVEQIQTLTTNEDLGLQEEATVEEKMNKFQDLLQDLNSQPLLEQILSESTETEDAMDEAILVGMEESGISTVQELKTLTFDENLEGDLLRRREDFNQAILNHMVTSGIVTQSEVDEDDDIVGNALEALNSRVETIDSSHLVGRAATRERVRVAEQLVNNGSFTTENPPTDADIDNAIDKKIVKLSNLLVDLAVETTVGKMMSIGGIPLVGDFSIGSISLLSDDMINNSKQVARDIITGAVEGTMESFENAAKGTKSEAEIRYEKELEKAEKKWAKKHGTKANGNVVDRIVKQENGDDDKENAVVKITLKFFGGVEQQGQSVTLSNRYSIKEFYDKAKKVESANLEKTQARFLQVYGDKLEEMQLNSFTFAKNPVEDMDGWSIYVVTNEEDTALDSEKEREVERKVREDTPERQALEELMEEYYSDIAEIFSDFVEANEIDSFDDITDNPDLEIELTKKLRLFFFRHGESSAGEKAKEVVNNLSEDIRFKNLLRDKIGERFAKKAAKDSKSKVKVTTKEEAEETAGKTITKAEVKKAKEEEKSDLMSQILESTITEQEQATENTASQEINDLLKQMREEVLVGARTENGNRALKREIMQY